MEKEISSLSTNLQLSPLEQQAVNAARQGLSTCSTHLADLGIIDRSQIKSFHEALRRVAKKAGVYGEGWIGRLGLLIYGSNF